MEKKTTSRSDGFGILNAYGDLWTPRVWPSETEAGAYLDDCRDNFDDRLLSHKVVPVKIRHKFPL